MALRQLDPEQIRTWSRLEKDRWWLANVYRGDLPQLTIRSALATRFGSEETAMGRSSSASRAARSKALAAECRLPDP